MTKWRRLAPVGLALIVLAIAVAVIAPAPLPGGAVLLIGLLAFGGLALVYRSGVLR